MRYTLLLCIIMICSLGLQAQQVVISEAQKLSAKTPNLRILGKNNEGIIIYKFGKGSHIIEAYTDNLGLAWSQNLSIKQENSDITEIVVYPDYSIAFFTSQEKDFTVLYGQMLDSRFKSGGKFLVADTIFGNRYDVGVRLKTVTSQNKKHLLSYYPLYEGNNFSGLQTVGLSDQLDVLYRQKLTFPGLADSYKLVNVYPGNAGDAYYVFEDTDRYKRRYDGQQEFKIFVYNGILGELKELPVTFDQPVFGRANFSIDNLNNQFIIAGFYADEDRRQAKGYFMEQVSIPGHQVIREVYKPFGNDVLFQIMGTDTAQQIEGLMSFRPLKVTMRKDGGALIVAESQYDNTETEDASNFMPATGPNFRTVNVYYYNDILVLNMNPDGSLAWFNVLRKKQISEDDEGFFSSFCMMTDDNDLHFIYNEEIYYKTNVNDYAVNLKGEATRGYLFNAGMRDLMLAPALGKQISGNEVLVPSFRNRAIKFVKIKF